MMNKNNCIMLIFLCMPIYCAEKAPSKNAQKIQQYNALLFELLKTTGQTKPNDTAKALSAADATLGLQTVTQMLNQLTSIYNTKNMVELANKIAAEQQELKTSNEQLITSQSGTADKETAILQEFKATEQKYWAQLKENMTNALGQLKQTNAKQEALTIVPEMGLIWKKVDFKTMEKESDSAKQFEEKYTKLFNLFTQTMNKKQEAQRAKEAKEKRKKLEAEQQKAKNADAKKTAQEKLNAELDTQIQAIKKRITEKTATQETYQTELATLLAAAKLPENKDLTKLSNELQPITTFIDTMLTEFKIDNISEIPKRIEEIPNNAKLIKEKEKLEQKATALKESQAKGKTLTNQLYDLYIDTLVLLEYHNHDPDERKTYALSFAPRETRKQIEQDIKNLSKDIVIKHIPDAITDRETEAKKRMDSGLLLQLDDTPKSIVYNPLENALRKREIESTKLKTKDEERLKELAEQTKDLKNL